MFTNLGGIDVTRTEDIEMAISAIENIQSQRNNISDRLKSLKKLLKGIKKGKPVILSFVGRRELSDVMDLILNSARLRYPSAIDEWFRKYI